MSSFKLLSFLGEYFGFDVLMGLEVILEVPASSILFLDFIPSSSHNTDEN